MLRSFAILALLAFWLAWPSDAEARCKVFGNGRVKHKAAKAAHGAAHLVGGTVRGVKAAGVKAAKFALPPYGKAGRCH